MIEFAFLVAILLGQLSNLFGFFVVRHANMLPQPSTCSANFKLSHSHASLLDIPWFLSVRPGIIAAGKNHPFIRERMIEEPPADKFRGAGSARPIPAFFRKASAAVSPALGIPWTGSSPQRSASCSRYRLRPLIAGIRATMIKPTIRSNRTYPVEQQFPSSCSTEVANWPMGDLDDGGAKPCTAEAAPHPALTF